MQEKVSLPRALLVVIFMTVITLGICNIAAAHCDTLDGPVIQDARKALNAKGKKNAEAAENHFFVTLVKTHRAGEGAPFTGLKPAGEVEPAIAESDKALASGSVDALIKLVTDDVAAGIKKHFENAAATYKHKDESVEQGREFVEAYVAFTHYAERIHMDATGKGTEDEHHKSPKIPAKHGH